MMTPAMTQTSIFNRPMGRRPLTFANRVETVVEDAFQHPLEPIRGNRIDSDNSAGNEDSDLENDETEKIPRPRNSFIIFRSFMHQTIAAENPGLKCAELCK